THLLSLQSKDGSFNWIPGVAASPVITTAYAVMALKGTPIPVNVSIGRNSGAVSTHGRNGAGD
ncbi:MAG: hypothetical protein ABFD18_16850, partial [Syntrophomonas sp.]